MKKLGRWVLILLALEFVFAWWVGSRLRDRMETPLRIIGHHVPAPPSSLPG